MTGTAILIHSQTQHCAWEVHQQLSHCLSMAFEHRWQSSPNCHNRTHSVQLLLNLIKIVGCGGPHCEQCSGISGSVVHDVAFDDATISPSACIATLFSHCGIVHLHISCAGIHTNKHDAGQTFIPASGEQSAAGATGAEHCLTVHTCIHSKAHLAARIMCCVRSVQLSGHRLNPLKVLSVTSILASPIR